MMQQRRSEETHDRILAAAEESFARNGYDATGVAEICKRARVSKGAFYHHFPSKQAVFLDLLDRWLIHLEDELNAVRFRTNSVPEQLLDMADKVSIIFDAGTDRFSIFLEFWARAAREPEIWQRSISYYVRYQDYFAEMIAAGSAEGTLRHVDATQTAQIILSLAIGIIVQALLNPQGADWGANMHRGMELLLRSLQPA